MKRIKDAFKNVNKFGLLLIFALGLFVITQSAFTNAKADTYWVFDGTSIDDAKDAGQYHEDALAPSCVAGYNMPCKIKTDAAINDETALQTYLNTFSTPQDVLASVTDKRN